MRNPYEFFSTICPNHLNLEFYNNFLITTSGGHKTQSTGADREINGKCRTEMVWTLTRKELLKRSTGF